MLLLALTACAGDGRDVASPAETYAETPAETPAGSPQPSPLPQTSRCKNPAGRYALTYPFGWSMGGGPGIEPCRFFDDQPLAVIPEQTEVTAVAIRATVRDVPLEQASEDTGGEQEDRDANGLNAVRATGAYTDDPLLPPGTRFTTWLVDLGSRTLILTADTAAPGDYEETVRVLDDMARTVEAV